MSINAGLMSRRDELLAEHGRLTKINAQASDSQLKVDEIDHQLADLASAERADLERWAANGATGEPPALRSEERRRLEQARALAAADARAAVARRGAVQGRLGEIDVELSAIRDHLRRHSLGDVLAEARGLAGEVIKLAEDLRRPWMRLMALDQTLVAEIGAAASRGDRVWVESLSGVKAELDGRQEPNLNWDRASLDAAAAEWRGRL